MNACTRVDLEALLFDELPVTPAVQAKAHVSQCAACAGRLDELRRIRALFASPERHRAEGMSHLYAGIAHRTQMLADTRVTLRRYALAMTFAVMLALISISGLLPRARGACGPLMSPLPSEPEICQVGLDDEIAAAEARFRSCLVATPAL